MTKEELRARIEEFAKALQIQPEKIPLLINGQLNNVRVSLLKRKDRKATCWELAGRFRHKPYKKVQLKTVSSKNEEAYKLMHLLVEHYRDYFWIYFSSFKGALDKLLEKGYNIENLRRWKYEAKPFNPS